MKQTTLEENILQVTEFLQPKNDETLTIDPLYNPVINIALHYCETGSEEALQTLRIVQNVVMECYPSILMDTGGCNIGNTLPKTKIPVPSILHDCPWIYPSKETRRADQVRSLFEKPLTKSEKERMFAETEKRISAQSSSTDLGKAMIGINAILKK
jgi:hypothetical protein